MHKIHFFGGFQISPNAIIPLSESRVCYGPLTEYEGRISWLSKRLKVIISNVYFFYFMELYCMARLIINLSLCISERLKEN